jgi:hypothetical protein
MKKKIIVFCMLCTVFACVDAFATVTEVYTWTNTGASAKRFDWTLGEPFGERIAVNKGAFGLCISSSSLYGFSLGEVASGNNTTLGITISGNAMMPYSAHFISGGLPSTPSVLLGLSGWHDSAANEWVLTLANCAAGAPELQIKNLVAGITSVENDALTLPSASYEGMIGFLQFGISSGNEFEFRVGGLATEFPILVADIRYSGDVYDTQFKGHVVPEPASIALLGLGGLLLARRKC